MAYLALLIAIAAIGATLGATATLWHEVQQREKERELLFVGERYRRAIQQYYESSMGVKTFPPTLEALLLDARQPGLRRYLRRPYLDPLTNAAEWGLIKAPQGGIMGVYSLGKGTPIKQANFPSSLPGFEKKQSYADWQFAYLPPAALGNAFPTALPTAPVR